MDNIILASSSARRHDILSMCGIPFSVVVSDVDETIDETLAPFMVVLELSKRKALAVQSKLNCFDSVILGADTVVSLNGKIFGKPHSRAEAFSTLKKLSGKTHEVYTGVTLLKGDKLNTFYECTKVTFNYLDDEFINDYISSDEPLDKAGSYAIQGKGALLVNKIDGDFYNVVGLPISSVYKHLLKFQAY